MIWQKDPKNAGDDVHISGADYADWNEQNSVLSAMAAYPETEAFELIKDQQATEVTGLLATSNLLTVVGAQPILGRAFIEEEEKTRARVVLISQGFWQEHFAGDPQVLGRTVTLSAESYRVIGVLPAGFRLPWVGEFSVLAPLPLDTGVMRSRESHRLHVIARMRPGISSTQAEANFNLIDSRISQQRIESEKRLIVRFGSITEDNREIRRSLLVLMGAVGFVLLIACGNVANLLLSRGVGRRREFAIRCAIGASPLRVVRQLATESLLLGMAGCSVGILLAAWCTPYFAGKAEQFRNVSGISVDLHVAGFAILISLVTTVLFSVAPVMASAKPDVDHELKLGSCMRSTTSYAHQRIRGLLVNGEVALALVVLIGAGLLIRAFLNRAAADPGIHLEHLFTAEIHLKGLSYENPDSMRAYYAQALQNLASIPAVTQVSATSALPLGNGEITFMSFAVPGQRETGGEQTGIIRLVTPGYFDVIGAQLLRGRDFNSADSATAERVAIVNQTFVQRYFQGEDPVGKSLVLTDMLNFHTNRTQPGPVRIVGVAPAIKHWCIGCDPHSDAEIYVPFTQAPAQKMIMVLRYDRDPDGVSAAVRRQLQAVDSTQAVYSIETMTEQLSDAVRPFLFYPSLLSIFGLIALILACTGVYAVLSYSVAERSHEMGIRMALGATKQDITRMVAGRSGKLVATGIVAGIVSALGLTRFLSHLLNGVSPFDPATFAVISAMLVVVAAAASVLPAYRACKTDPMTALRHD